MTSQIKTLKTLSNKDFLPAIRLHQALDHAHQQGQFPSERDVSRLADLACKCKDHFTDNRVVSAFILKIVLEEIHETFNAPVNADRSVLDQLLDSIKEVANELIAPSPPDAALQKIGRLIRLAHKWVDSR